MLRIFLTSDLGCSTKVGGVRISQEINNINGLVDQIKKELIKTDKMVFIVSSPTNYDLNDNYANQTFESFRKSGIVFENEVVIDDRFEGNLEEIKDADLVFLAGGNTAKQMDYFKRIGLREILEDFKGVIIGQSAGALNLADEVLCSPEYKEEIGNTYKWNGLGLTQINIEPHFVLNVTADVDIKLRKELLKISCYKHLYAICDGTHILIDEKSATIYGEAYLVEDGLITMIKESEKILQQFNITAD